VYESFSSRHKSLSKRTGSIYSFIFFHCNIGFAALTAVAQFRTNCHSSWANWHARHTASHIRLHCSAGQFPGELSKWIWLFFYRAMLGRARLLRQVACLSVTFWVIVITSVEIHRKSFRGWFARDMCCLWITSRIYSKRNTHKLWPE